MAKRNIIKLGDDTLRKISKPVEDFDERLWELLDDLKETLYGIGGVGLAACQTGILKRVAFIDVGYPKEPAPIELVNPAVVNTEGEQTGKEGCLSIPGREENITRPNVVVVRAQDRFGNPIEVRGEGFLARALCHELDHMDGVLYIDKM